MFYSYYQHLLQQLQMDIIYDILSMKCLLNKIFNCYLLGFFFYNHHPFLGFKKCTESWNADIQKAENASNFLCLSLSLHLEFYFTVGQFGLEIQSSE